MMRIGRFFQLVALILLAAGAQPAATAVYQWSTTAGTNATADPTINWAEGQAPSSINDSARAMMAALAIWRNDISGAISATGSASAYAVTTGQGFAAVTDLRFSQITFVAPATNADGVTLNVNGIGAYPIQIATGVPVPAGSMVAGGVYTVTGYGTVAPGTFTLRGYYSNTFNIPLGAYIESSVFSPPNANFVEADGSCISRTTYAAYFALAGTAYGGCDGSTTFGLPDRRGRVAAMVDGGAGRLTSSASGCGVAFNAVGATCGNESQTLTLAQVPAGITSPVSVTTSTTNIGVIPVSSGSISSLQTQGNPTANITPANNNGTWSGVTSLAGGGSGTATSNNTGGGAHPNVQPTIAVKVFVRVL